MKNNVKYWIIAFFITFLIFIAFYVKYSVGLFFDIPAMFSVLLLNSDDNSNSFLIYSPNRVRVFNDFLIAIPFNIIFPFIKNSSALNALRLYSSSYFIIHLIGLIILYLSAKRTKRYDIAAIGFMFYALFCIPNAIWAVREVHITILFYFSLLTWFLSKENLNFKDLIPVSLLGIYLFESFETTIVIGAILFIFGYTYINKQKTEENPWFKALISFFGLLAVIYIPIKMLYFRSLSALSFSQGLTEWINSSLTTLNTFFDGNILIPCFSIVLILSAIFYKKIFGLKSFCLIIPYIIIASYIVYLRTGFVSNPNIEIQYYSIALWFIVPVILFILFTDYYKINISKFNPAFFANIAIIASIIGILNLLWQINSFYDFGKYESYLKNLINQSNEVIVKIPEEDFEKYNYLRFDTCFGTMHKSIFLTEKGQKAKLIMPAKNDEFCFADIQNYDKESDILQLQTSYFKNKTRYWDLSDIKAEISN